jgi:hypothetical protein
MENNCEGFVNLLIEGKAVSEENAMTRLRMLRTTRCQL